MKRMGLRKALVENNFNEVCAFFEERKGHRIPLNRLWSFSTKGVTLQVPPICVAICHRNILILQCLLKHGASPERVGHIYLERGVDGLKTKATFSPFMLALEDHEGLPFDPAVASALVEGGADINSTFTNGFVEEEEEGGSICYQRSSTLLFKLVDPFLPASKPSVRFLLDNGADMFFRNERGITVLQSFLCLWSKIPGSKDFSMCSKELIRYGGFMNTPLLPAVTCSEFIMLLSVWSSSIEEERNATLPQSMVHFLLDAGYKCCKTDIDYFKKTEFSRNVDQYLADKVYGLHLYSLKELCRMRIRQNVQHGCQLQKLKCLPQRLIDYLKFEEI
ncbi:hypothetical protein ACOMHN_032911 [Nucella lapillus]